MNNWFDGYIYANDIKLHYYRTGGDLPKIVINHGVGDDGLCWTHLAKALERDYDIILPDARGHGKSASGQGAYSIEQRVADLAGIITGLKLDRPVLGGHSMGADTVLNFAAEYPELTRGIFIEDPPIILSGEKLGNAEMQLDSVEDFGKMMGKFFRMFKFLPKFISLPMAKKANPSYPDDEIYPWLDSKRRVSMDLIKNISSMAFDPDAPFEAIAKVQSPILLFIGDKEKMSIMSQEGAAKAAETNDKLRVVHLEGASHDIRRTRFDGYLPALKSFLQGISAA